jgi:hypothetical protein
MSATSYSSPPRKVRLSRGALLAQKGMGLGVGSSLMMKRLSGGGGDSGGSGSRGMLEAGGSMSAAGREAR